MAQSFLKGLRQACEMANCALIGGETAEMPGVYQKNDFDCAGFAVGVVDETKLWGADRVKVGDKIIAFPSSGFHSNGYSLLRKVFAEDIEQWQDILLKPTQLYPSLIAKLKTELDIHALAHITGGGMDNLLRVIPEKTGVSLNPWKVPAMFREVKQRAEMSWESLLKTLNCGIGMAMFIAAEDFDQFSDLCLNLKQDYWLLGEVIHSEDKTWQLDLSQMDEVNS